MMKWAVWVGSGTALAAALLSSGGAGSGQDSKIALRGVVMTTRGEVRDLSANPTDTVRVFVFLSKDCPISNGSIAALNRLDAAWKSQGGIEFAAVAAPGKESRRELQSHFEEFKAAFPVLFDKAGVLLDALRPTHVPEAFVVDREGRLAYRGAIDNAWVGLGRRRPAADKHYLRDAASAVFAGKTASPARTEPVGCLIEEAPDTAAGAEVTFADHIAPILLARCISCHRPGQAAPFSLIDYEDAAKRAGQLARVTRKRVMPPWMPSEESPKMVGDRWLSQREIDLFERWAETGRARGNDIDAPTLPVFAEGWTFGKPDLIVRMKEPFDIPADGPDLLHNFVIPIDIPEDKLVAAVEVHPGNKRAAHHAVLLLDSSGIARQIDNATPEPGYSNARGPGFFPSGALGGWSVGNTPRALPNGMGRHLAKGSDLVLQMHYHPTGKPERDQSEVGIYFVDKPVREAIKESRKLVGSIWISNYQIDIPAGKSEARYKAEYTLPRGVVMVGVVPHMHLLGKSIKVHAVLPDGRQKVLADIPHWNYNWQDEYYYERPFELPSGTRLVAEGVFDNSENNPSNPSLPPKRVTWGDGTLDEMMFCFFLITADKTEDTVHVILDNLQHDSRLPRLKQPQ